MNNGGLFPWKNERGNRLNIKKVDDKTALLSSFAASGRQPIRCPWCGGEPSVDMIARYSPPYGRELKVELWGKRRGFILALTFEAEYELNHAKRDVLVPGLSRYEKDHFLDRYCHLFEPLNHYTKAT